MSRFHSYINSAKEILSLYSGDEPFSSFIKKHFARHKKFGSKDRKEIANLCYCYFRMGKVTMDLPVEEKIVTALFLCSKGPNDLLQNLKPVWNELTSLAIEEKLSTLNYALSSVFPWKEELSDGIEYEKFCESFFIQPDLFLRIRPGHAENVLLKLNEAEVDFEFISPFTIRLPNTFKADKYFELDKEVVVQDFNSQQVAGFIPLNPDNGDKVWDCCAGSGGKSIMAHDLNSNLELVVSDIRESILVNLKKRFEKAGIKKYKSIKLNLNKENSQQTITNSQFSLIIADVPCTGSGTWSRTPEQLYYFDKKKIDEYVALQKRIVSNVVPHMQPGGHLLYITCSVFKKENEEIVNYLKEKFQLQLVKMPARMTRSYGELLKGYDMKADTMFAALLQKPL